MCMCSVPSCASVLLTPRHWLTFKVFRDYAARLKYKMQQIFLNFSLRGVFTAGNFTLYSCSEGKEMYKKSAARAELLF